MWVAPQILLAQRVRPGPCGDLSDLPPLASAAAARIPFGRPRHCLGLSCLRQGPIPGPLGDVLGDTLLALPGRLRQASPVEAAALAGAARTMVAGCLLNGAVPQAAAGGGGPPRKERVRRAIRQHIGFARLTPERLAALAGISRSGLYRLFEAGGGVARYVQAVRLSLARAAIRDPTRAADGIAAIAEAHGFPDASAFSRAFRQAYGVTPREARVSALGGASPAQPPRPVSAGRAHSLAEVLYRQPLARAGRPPD